MSLSFRLKYAFGLIPKAHKLDLAWDELLQMREDLHKIKDSKELARYIDLKGQVNSPEFQANKKKIEALKFEGSEASNLEREFKSLSSQKSVREYLKYKESADFDTANPLASGPDISKYLELEKAVVSPDFVLKVEYLKNKNRYQTSPEFLLESELEQLEKSEIIQRYLNIQAHPKRSFIDEWEIVLNENFTEAKLSTALWEPENFWGSRIAGFTFSQATELQAFNGLDNIRISNNVLSIVTKAEKVKGKAWDASLGLINKDFEYTSAILNTGNGFKFKEGVIEAKVRFRADAAITSAFSLTGDKPFPQIDIFRSGPKRVGLGVIDHPKNGGVKKLVQIKGLNFSEFHIFSLEIHGDLLIWKINNYEVHRDSISHNSGDLFLNFIGSLHKPLNHNDLPHHFEIEWVRCLKRRTK